MNSKVKRQHHSCVSYCCHQASRVFRNSRSHLHQTGGQDRQSTNHTAHDQQCPGCEHRDRYLFEWDTPGQQLDEVSGSHDGVWVKCFLCGANCDASLDQVQRGFDVLRRTKKNAGYTRRERQQVCNLNQPAQHRSVIQPTDG